MTFLVISDGRGNVPAKARRRNIIEKRIIGPEGVEDALGEAVQLSALQRIETILLNPQPLYYPELPEILAQALGAEMQVIPRQESGDGMGAEA